MELRDRRDAGRQLAVVLAERTLRSPVVLALPRGGVPVAFEVAWTFQVPLEVFVARKVGAPGQPELGMGAIAEGGGAVMDRQAVQAAGVEADELDHLVEVERRELDRRVRHYRGDRPLPDLAGRDVVLVDDGLATGVTAEVALRALRDRNPGSLVLAVPVGASGAVDRLGQIADAVICLARPQPFHAVGQFYAHFDQTTDEEVLDLLARTRTHAEAAP